MPRTRQRTGSGLRITAAVCIDRAADPAAAAVASLGQQSLPVEAYEILMIGDDGIAASADRITGALGPAANLRPVAAAADPDEMRNQALREARAPLLAFLDAQAVAEPGWLSSLCRTFAQFGTRAHAVGGPVRPLWEGSRPGWLGDELLADLSLVDLGEEARFLAAGERLAAVNIAFRKDELEALGGFPAVAVGAPAAAGSDPPGPLAAIIAAGRAVYDPLAAVQYQVPAERVSQRWFRGRAAWRAVTELSRSPPTADAIAERWQAVKNFFFACPPTERTIRGLVLEQSDPRRFQEQIAAVYDSLFCLLSGVGETDYD